MQKNEIYIEMLRCCLPHIRNVQTHGVFRKATDKSCYYEAELVHNIALTILNPAFEMHDIHFLNHQAKYYVENCSAKISINYEQQVRFIKEIFKLVPDDLKEYLYWEGPN